MSDSAIGAASADAPTSPKATRVSLSPTEYNASERWFVWGVWLLQLLVLIVVTWRHEPWRDEVQAWRLAIDSPDIRSLAANARMEGHPLLWHVLLQLLGKISRTWWMAAAVHTAFASATAWLILRCAPLPRWQRAMMIFGYYLLYEYAVIVRAYGPGVFFAVAALVAWTYGRRRPVLTGLLLVMLANTSVMGLLVACSATVGLFLDWAWPDDAADRRPMSRILGVGLVIAVSSLLIVALVYVQVRPPSTDNYSGDGAVSSGEGLDAWSVATAIATPAKAFLPIAGVNENGLQWRYGLVHPNSRTTLLIADLLSIGFVLAACVAVARRRAAVLLVLTGSVAMVVFSLFLFQGGQRHHGHLVLIWLMAVWLAGAGSPTNGLWPTFSRRLRALPSSAFALLHLPLLLAGAQYALGDIQLPFSDAMRTAQFVDRREFDGLPVVANPPNDGVSVGAHSHRPFWLAVEGRVATFVTWSYVDPSLKGFDDGNGLDQVAMELMSQSLLQRHCSILAVITPETPLPASLQQIGTRIYETTGMVISGERFEVWRLQQPHSPACPATDR